MKVLGICGSPRKGGNSDTLLDKALEGAASAGADTEKLVLDEMDISPVREKEYGNITDEGLSVVNDDANAVLRKIAGCDVLIIASPVFFGSVSTQTKIMIDRAQCLWVAKNVHGREVFPARRKGAFICVAGSDREDFFENARSIIKHFFAVINADYEGELFCAGVDKKAEVLERPETLESASELGRILARTTGR